RRPWAVDPTAPPSGTINVTRTAIARSGGEGGGSVDCSDSSCPLGPPPCECGDGLEQEAGGGSPRAPLRGSSGRRHSSDMCRLRRQARIHCRRQWEVRIRQRWRWERRIRQRRRLAVIAAGARTVVVAGMIPIGCEPEMLALFPGGAGNYYDPASGCITRFNDLAELHNRELQRALHELRRAHPGATAVRYADLYGPVAAAVASPKEYGFGSSPLAACCGSGGGPYNFNANFTGFCATPRSTVCADGPSSSVSWDGIHYTEATNKLVARAILTRP
ncbi:hypothetical protein EE612_051204, partial [Oryza sativa]